MKKFVPYLTIAMFSLVVLLVLISATTSVWAATTPYYTFTTDNEYGMVKTSDAYTPGESITDFDNTTFRTPEFVFIDHEDYIYVTDSGHAKVFIFDKDHNFVDEISFLGDSENDIPAFFGVNSVYVTEDKIYVPDSFAKTIFIFDRDRVLHRPQSYNLWFEDVDASDSASNGDLVYIADEDGEPTGAPVYEVAIQGQSADGNDIVGFVNLDTSELEYTKTIREEMLGKIITWTSRAHDGTTVLRLNVFAESNQPIQLIQTPDAPVFQEGYTFTPRRVVVDTRGNMYVVGAQSDNGLIMLGEDGSFITFFGGNPLRTPLVDQIRSFMLSDKQKEQLREQSDIYIDYVTGVAIDEKGFVYTVTSSLEDGVIKKYNVSGVNYFNEDAPGWVGAVDLWVGNYGNVVVVEEYGWINEYNESGQLVFSFSVSSQGIKRDGLLSLPKSIAIDSNDTLYVVDQGGKLVQTYEPTEFTNSIHRAFQAYQDGDEIEAMKNWNYSLEYATVFDIAHVGLGDALIRQERYNAALEEYTLASYNPGISDTYWQVRQDWLEDNLDTTILVLLGLLVLRWFFAFFNRKYHWTKGIENGFKELRKKSKVVDELSYIPTFIKHPLDGYYEIKRHNRVGMKTAGVIYFLLALVYVMYQEVTNVIFLASPNVNVLYRLIILGVVLTLWVIANYFVCLIRDGEGTFKQVFVSTAMSFTPILFVFPPIILLSNVLTYQELVFFNVPLTFTMIWVTIYFFFMIKEIHNYEVGETFGIIFVSMFTMLIMGIFLFVIYSLNSQIFNVSLQIGRELLER